jgi:tetratricopeptide (TPR) repeat protein
MMSLRIVLILMVLMLLGVGCTKQVTQQGPVTEVAAEGHTLRHTVAKGETLRRIADNYFGDPDLAGAIAAMNGITDPDRIVPGSVLVLEFDESQWQGARKRSVALDAYNKGVDLMAQDRLAEAEKQFRLALDTSPDLESASYNLALVLAQRGKNAEALVILDKLTASSPENTDFHFARGHSLFLVARFSEAATEFQKVLSLEGEHKRAVFGMARSLQEDGQKQKAMKAWDQYLELDSTSSWADVARRNLKKLRDGS